MSIHNFKRLIKKYQGKPVIVIEDKEGYYNDIGDWIEGEKEYVEIEGACVPLDKETLIHGEGGTYNEEDRKFYSYVNLSKGTDVLYNDKIYTIVSRKDYEDYDEGLFIYVLKKGGVDDAKRCNL